jgi:hypothetical protein
MKMALKNPSANCFRKFKGLQLTFQVVLQTVLSYQRHGSEKQFLCHITIYALFW